MFLSNSELTTRIKSGRNIADRIATEIVEERGGLIVTRANNGNRVEDELRPIIGQVTAVTSSRKAGELFGLDSTTANDLKNEVKARTDSLMEAVHELAINKISACLGGVTKEKLQDLSAKTLSEVSRNLSSVVRNTRREDKSGDEASRYQFVVLAPHAKKVNMFDVADV